MKKILSTAIVTLALINAKAQTMYKMESPAIFDEDGNMYQMRDVLDHKPTHEDSVAFDKAVKEYIKQIDKARKLRLGIKQYEAVVGEVRIDKDGNTVVKPTAKFKSEWYRYYGNVKVGDTIVITREDAIEPKF
jgi:hypothetical protein